MAGRPFYVARRSHTRRDRVVCGVAPDTAKGAGEAGGGSHRLVPPQDASSELVLAAADGTPRNPLARPRRNPLRTVTRLFRMLFWHRFGAAFAGLIAILGVGFALLATAVRYSVGNALYLTFLDAAGAAVTDPTKKTPEKIAQLLLTFDGLAFLPLATAAVVGARLTGSVRGHDRPISDHVIVAGLGNVGTRILGQLHDLGIGVVCVDKDADAAGVPLARRLGLRVVTGETTREETLLAAGVTSCRALVSVTDSDIVNLETALHARALAEQPRILLPLYDDDLTGRVPQTVGNTVSRSVPYLAAPAFAAAMLEPQVLRTIPVGRHVLLIADVQVDSGSELAGRLLEAVHQTGEVRVIALRRKGADGVDWSPRRDYTISPQDPLYVLATRAGLRHLPARSQAPADSY